MTVTPSDTLAQWAARHVRTLQWTSTAASPDSVTQIDARRVLASLVLRQECSLSGHTALVWATALGEHPDGRLLLATASNDSTARIWDAHTGTCMRTLTGHTGSVYSVAWCRHPDGRLLLATGGADQTARIWDPDTGTCLRTLTDRTAIWSVDLTRHPNGRLLLATAGNDSIVRIWDPDTGTCLRTLTGHTAWVGSMAWTQHADGRLLLATASGDFTVRIWDGDTGTCLHTLTDHTDTVYSVAWTHSSGRSLLATGSKDFTARIWDPETGTCLRSLTDHTGTVFSVAWARLPDGHQLMATSSADRTARVWDLDTGTCLQTLTHEAQVNSVNVGWDHDGRLVVATGSHDYQAYLWISDPLPASQLPAPTPALDTRQFTIELAATLTGHVDRVWGTALFGHPDGRLLLATASADHTARIWDAETGTCLHTLTDHTNTVVSVAWGRHFDGRLLLATASWDSTARIWDPDTGICLRTLTDHTVSVQSVAWTRHFDGRLLLATGGGDSTARIWDPDTGTCLHTLTGHSDSVLRVAWGRHPDGHLLLATAGVDSTVRIWDPDTGARLHTLTGHTNNVYSVAWGRYPDGRLLLATASEDRTVRVWDPDTGACLRTITDHTGYVWSVAWVLHPDGYLLLATASEDSTARIWDPETGTCLQILTHAAAVNGIDLGWDHPNRRLVLATGSDDNHAHLWISDPVPAPQPPALPIRARALDPSQITVEQTASLTGHTDRLWDTALLEHPDGRLLLATASEDSTGRIWDAATGTCLHTLTGHTSTVYWVAWASHSDGRFLLATGSADHTARVWDAATGTCVPTLTGHTGSVYSVAWAHMSDGRLLLATGSADNTARIWDSDTGTCLHTLTDHTHQVLSVAWGRYPDGRLLLATASYDQTVRIWDPDTGSCLHTLAGHTEYVWSVAWSRHPDGRLLMATASADFTARIWEPDTGSCLHILTGHTGIVRSVAWTHLPDGHLLLATASSDSTVRIWDPDTGICLQTLTHGGPVNCVDLGWDHDLRLVLAIGGDDNHAHLWTSDVPISMPVVESPRLAPSLDTTGRGPLVAISEVVALGSAGMWAPLGTLSDLITLTGPMSGSGRPSLHDPRLQGLAAHPGVRELRELCWPMRSRAAFAAHLYQLQPVLEGFNPPDGTTPLGHVAALTTALRTATRAVPPPVDIPAFITVADSITPATVALCRIVGPDAAAMDPLMLTRLAHHTAQLPELTATGSALLSVAPASTDPRDSRANGATSTRTAGTAGITRHGPPTALLHTQLALPRPMFVQRFATGDLLHRHHPAATHPPIRPVTIILDTTPPAFGACESTLRLVAHLLTTALWRHGLRPALVTLTAPDACVELGHPRDLLGMWVSRTLESPALAVALETAAARATHPTITLTVDTAVDAHPTPSAEHQLVTTHHPGFPLRGGVVRGFHHHLDPSSGDRALLGLVEVLLAGASGDRSGRS